MADEDPITLQGSPSGCSASVFKPKSLDPTDTHKLNE